MGEVARSGTTTGVFRGLEHAFTITTHDPALTAALGQLYAPLASAPGADDAVTAYLVVPPTPGEIWQLQVDGQTKVRSSTPGGLLRMLLRTVDDAIHRRVPAGVQEAAATQEHDDGETVGVAPGTPLHLTGAAIAADGEGLVLLGGTPAVRTAVLVALLDRSGERVDYLGQAAVRVAPDRLTVTAAPVPLSLERSWWDRFGHLREQVPAALTPYLDLEWPLPATSVGPLVDQAALKAIVYLEVADADTAGTSPAAPSPAASVARLLDHLPWVERRSLTAARLHEVASVVERVQVGALTVGVDPQAAGQAVMGLLAEATVDATA